MTNDEKRMIRRTIAGLLVLAAVAFAGNVNFLGQIPTHGVLLELTLFEWALLVWVAATPYVCR